MMDVAQLSRLVGRVDAARPRRWLDAAGRAAIWLRSVTMPGPSSWFSWCAVPDRPDPRCDPSIYYGGAGAVLFFLDLYRANRDPEHLRVAVAGARGIARQRIKVNGDSWWPIPHVTQPPRGYYLGSAGIASVLLTVADCAGDRSLRTVALDAMRWTCDRRARHAVDWPAANDVLSGTAGVGLALLDLARRTGRADFLDSAVHAGDHLLSQRQLSGTGWCWSGTTANAGQRPSAGFGHGIAGIAYFFARLFQDSRDERFLAAAIHGASWLEAARKPLKSGAAWPSQPEPSTAPPYLGWCYGAAGISRLFFLLHTITGDSRWTTLFKSSLRWIRQSGMLTRRLKGMWNVGMCCGIAGVGDHFATLFAVSGDPSHYEWAVACGEAIVALGEPANGGLRWTQSEYRLQPEYRYAQVGYGHGAAGIGLFLCHLARLTGESRSDPVLLADNPFSSSSRS